MNLINEMKGYLPLYAYPTPQLLSSLRDKGLKHNSKLEITDVSDSGEAGGLMCTMHIAEEVFVISLTYLDFRDEHPLKDKIREYQVKRLNMIKTETIVRDNFVGRNDPCPCGSGKKYKKWCGNSF